MKIIIDECLPKRLSQLFTEHEVWTVPQIGLAGCNDTNLLNELDKKDIDIFITIDSNIEYQQSFENRNFGTIIIRSVTNRLNDLLHLEKEIKQVINEISRGKIVRVPE